MKSLLIKLSAVACLLAVTPFSAQAKLVAETDETIQISINSNNFDCQLKEIPAHTGVLTVPEMTLMGAQIKGVEFVHNTFAGYMGMSHTTCDALKLVTNLVDQNGKVTVQKNVRLSVLVYQESNNGPVTAIETSEVIRLTFANGLFVESRISILDNK